MTSGEGFLLIRPSASTRSAWANGRGYTRELTHDASRSWRLSIADIGREAPFSTLPGIDRTLVVAAGEVLLRVDGREHRLVTGEAVAFRGESDASAVAFGDTAHVVNLMSVRGAAEFDGHGARRAREVALPQTEDEIVLVLSHSLTLDGIPVEPGTVLVTASSDTTGAEHHPAAPSLHFPEPVIFYRLTRRTPQ